MVLQREAARHKAGRLTVKDSNWLTSVVLASTGLPTALPEPACRRGGYSGGTRCFRTGNFVPEPMSELQWRGNPAGTLWSTCDSVWRPLNRPTVYSLQKDVIS
jgi:hypothetical protein